MQSKYVPQCVLLVSVTLFALIGCGGDGQEPRTDTTDDVALKENLIGTWDVISINEAQPAVYLVEVVTAEDTPIPGEPETPIPAAPAGNKRGEFVDLIEDATPASVKIKDEHIYYNFEADDTWSLSIVFEMVPNDQDGLLGEGEQDSAAGEGWADPPPDPEKENMPVQDPEPLPPVQDSEILFKKIEVAGIWAGTYSISDGLLSFITTAADVKLTPILDARSPNLSDTEKEKYRNELKEKISKHLLKPAQNVYITTEDETLTLTAPGESHKIILNRQQ